MRRSYLFASGFVGVLSVSGVLLSTQAAESRPQRTLNRADLYEVVGGFVADYCCSNVSDCAPETDLCSDFDGLDQETCDTYQQKEVTTGNQKSCSAYSPGNTCSAPGTYSCTDYYACVWQADGQKCVSLNFTGSENVPDSCEDDCPPH